VTYKLRILSLGAGVQSSTLLLMAEKGVIEPFNCAIFADTGWESQATYQWLEWLKSVCRTPIITVMSNMGSIYDWSLESHNRSKSRLASMPFYTLDGMDRGMLMRQCTDNFKIVPIRKETRRLLGLVPKQRAPHGAVEQAVGISLDEARRMKLSRDRMTFLSYPLVHMGMSRHDCQNWLTRNGYPIPPKSSCVGCPFHHNNEWREVMADPVGWQQAVTLDGLIRNAGIMDGRSSARLFLHRSCKPLEEVDFSTPEERGQEVFEFVKDEKLNLFVNNLSI
jgi:hypothetical protein